MLQEQFRAKIDDCDLDEKDREFCDDACLDRYLIANKQNLELSFQKLLQTLKWRKDYGVDQISWKDIQVEGVHNSTYVNGFCREGRPIIYIKKRKDYGDPEAGLKLLVYTLENAISKMKPGVSQWIIIFDFEFYSRHNSPPFHISKQTLEILSHHYPERMAFSFFTYNPMVFGIFWNLIYPFLDPRTKSKIHFLGTEFSRLQELIDDLQLEEKYGGGRKALQKII